MTQPHASSSPLSPDDQEKLRELTAQSWNLELVISGAALFAILQLPDLLDQAFDYFRYNLMSHTEGMRGLLPSLAYSMMKATCYVLFFAFLANFVMRAFWVGLVGLLAVYPTGIHYDRLPFSTRFAQERLAAELGSLEAYILRLDRKCNIVFALAFLLVFLLIVVALMYLLVVVVYSVLQPLIPDPALRVITLVVKVVFALYFIASVTLSIKQVREHPTGTIAHYRFTNLSRFLFFGLYKPFAYINSTFYSHLPHSKILRVMVVFMSVFMVLILAEFTIDLSRIENRSSGLLNRRFLFTARDDSRYVEPSAYDNLRGPDGFVDAASIQSDVVREPYLRLFIAYPKALDTLLTEAVSEPEWSDTLSRTELRRQFAQWSNGRVNQLIQISVNDSLYPQPDLLFTQLGEARQRGWQTVLIPKNLKEGKNLLRIAINTKKQTEELATIPFWYVPEK